MLIGDATEARGHRGAANPREMNAVQRLPVLLQIALGIDIAPWPQPTLLAGQKTTDDVAERLVGCAHACLSSVGGRVVPPADPCEQFACGLTCLKGIKDLGGPVRHATLPAAWRVLHDEGARATRP